MNAPPALPKRLQWKTALIKGGSHEAMIYPAKRFFLSHNLSTETNQNSFKFEQMKFASGEKFGLVEIRL